MADWVNLTAEDRVRVDRLKEAGRELVAPGEPSRSIVYVQDLCIEAAKLIEDGRFSAALVDVKQGEHLLRAYLDKGHHAPYDAAVLVKVEHTLRGVRAYLSRKVSVPPGVGDNHYGVRRE